MDVVGSMGWGWEDCVYAVRYMVGAVRSEGIGREGRQSEGKLLVGRRKVRVWREGEGGKGIGREVYVRKRYGMKF